MGLSRLLQLCSQALPVGAYAYSTGLEAAIEAGQVKDSITAENWIQGVFRGGFASLDVPALLVAAQAVADKDHTLLQQLNDYLHASRETRELLLEDIEMGRALQRLLVDLGIPLLDIETPAFPLMFATAGRHWGIDVDVLAEGFCFSWLENQVGVATKTIPLGQTAAQQMLGHLLTDIPGALTLAHEAVDDVVPQDWCFGQSLPALAIYSSHHETQAARLYRS